ncbi:MAG: outer membrane protein transport protein [Deltaproteobacteria bacterium]|nr:outer membrane protein transport protein [Deltaproteobacteria bacterium]
MFKILRGVLAASLVAVTFSGLFAQTVSSVIGGISTTPTRPTPAGVVWNPALIGALSNTQIETNLSLLGGWLIYDRQGTDPNTGKPYKSSSMNSLAPNPYFSISSPLGTEKFRFAFTSYFPSGAMARFDDEGSQRYEFIRGYMLPWHNQLTIAYRPNPTWTFAVAGISSTAFFQTELDVDLSHFMEGVLHSSEIPKESSALASRAQIPQSWTQGWGGAIGILYWPTYEWSMGLSFFSPIVYNFEGDLNLQSPSMVSVLGSGLRALGVEEVVPNRIKARSVMPAFLQLGTRFQPFGYWTNEYFGRYTFSSWNRSLSIRVQNSQIAALHGFEIPGKALNDTFLMGTVQTFSFWQRWNLGTNINYYLNGTDDQVLSLSRADFDSLMTGVFLHYSWNKKLTLGAEYAHTFMFDRSSQDAEISQNNSTNQNQYFRLSVSDAHYRASLDRVGLNLKYAF